MAVLWCLVAACFSQSQLLKECKAVEIFLYRLAYMCKPSSAAQYFRPEQSNQACLQRASPSLQSGICTVSEQFAHIESLQASVSSKLWCCMRCILCFSPYNWMFQTLVGEHKKCSVFTFLARLFSLPWSEHNRYNIWWSHICRYYLEACYISHSEY